MLLEEISDGVSVVTFVGKELFDARNQTDAFLCYDTIGDVAGREDKCPWPAMFVDHRVDFAVAPALRKPDRLKISPPVPAIGAAVDLNMGTIERGRFWRLRWSGNAFEYLLPDTFFAPTREAIIDGLGGTVFSGAVLPAATNLQNMHDPAQNTAIVLASGPGLFNRQVRNDFRPLRITEPK